MNLARHDPAGAQIHHVLWLVRQMRSAILLVGRQGQTGADDVDATVKATSGS